VSVKDTNHSFVSLFLKRAGAVGINLTQANRVFLMEPSFNPALEAQAIGRVHRLGQKRNVEIVRFVMKDSVESRILEMLEKKYGGSMASNDDDGIKKPEVASLVGSIHTDRTAVLGEEFDILFGTAGSPSASSEVETEIEMEVDAVLSF
jgi:superfamily II DNA or RNA helicase